MYDKAQTVCFTGHRKLLEQRCVIEQRLEAAVRECIANGARSFVTGGALGFDTLAAQLIIRLRKEFPDIKLTLALPCPTEKQTARWSDEQKKEYFEIYSKADYIKIVSERYMRGCMHVRDRFMVDMSSTAICYLREERGGTFYTVGYARKKGVVLIEI